MTLQNLRSAWVIGTAKRANKDTYAIEPLPGDQPGKACTCVASTNLFTSNAHGLAAGDQGFFSGMTGGAGITAGALYSVIATGLTANAFKVSNTPGGAELDVTSDMTAGTFRKLTIGQRRFLKSGDAVPFGWAVPPLDQDDATTVDVKPVP